MDEVEEADLGRVEDLGEDVPGQGEDVGAIAPRGGVACALDAGNGWGAGWVVFWELQAQAHGVRGDFEYEDIACGSLEGIIAVYGVDAGNLVAEVFGHVLETNGRKIRFQIFRLARFHRLAISVSTSTNVIYQLSIGNGN